MYLEFGFFSFYKTRLSVNLNAEAAIYKTFVGGDELVFVTRSFTASKFMTVLDLMLCFNKHLMTVKYT